MSTQDQSKKRYASPAEAAMYFGASVSTLYRLARRGELHQYQIGRRIFYDLRELDELMAAHIINGEAVREADG